MPPRPPDSQAPRPQEGITLLGGPQTGKTTFLAALQIALLHAEHLGWSVGGNDPASTQAMIGFMDTMTRLHAFPRPTREQLEKYKWVLTGDTRRVWVWDRWLPRREDRTTRIPLDVVDGPGGAADNSKGFTAGLGQDLVQSMASSAGLIIFFDPLMEVERGETFQHLYGALRTVRDQLTPRGKLPHYVAVCITKYDAVPVYRSAVAMRVVEQSPDGQRFPYVPESDAEDFLRALIKKSSGDDASLIPKMIKQTFYKDRVRFFVTSAIGFYVATPDGVFDGNDYQNHVRGKPDRIRGGVYPINVVEPVLWLGNHVAKATRQ